MFGLETPFFLVSFYVKKKIQKLTKNYLINNLEFSDFILLHLSFLTFFTLKLNIILVFNIFR